MDEFAPFEDIHLLEAVLDEILHRLYVVVCHLLDFLHLGSILRSHVPVDVSECFKFRVVEIRKLWQRNLTKCDEILDFAAAAVLDQCVFAEVLSKWFSLTRIASVDRRYRQKCMIVHFVLFVCLPAKIQKKEIYGIS